MTTTKTPGVYIEEVSTLPASVAQVATAVPAFLGYTELNGGEVKRIGSFAEFVSFFGGPEATVTITLDASDEYTSGPVHGAIQNYLYYALQLYFQNGGGDCYVISTGVHGTPTKTHFTDSGAALDKLKRLDEPTLIVPIDAYNMSQADYYDVIDACLSQCNDLKDRFVIADAQHDTDTATSAAALRDGTDGLGANYLKYGAAYYPEIKTTLTYPDTAIEFAGTGVNIPTGTSLASAIATANGASGGDVAAALNKLEDPSVGAITAARNGTITVPASAAMAGLYCAVDRDRGVWKAPANVSIAGGSPSVTITHADQEGLNVDATGGKSINAIRAFTGKGTLVWGARTLAGNDNEWRYVPVRRLFITVEESIQKASQFVVFEPNDANTWAKVKGMIENYLNGLWRQGALAGATPEQAYFVKVGLGDTMTAQDILEGKLIIEIGMAAVRPAEFIILKFSHKLQES